MLRKKFDAIQGAFFHVLNGIDDSDYYFLEIEIPVMPYNVKRGTEKPLLNLQRVL